MPEKPSWITDIEAFLQFGRDFHRELQQVGDAIGAETSKAIDGNLSNGRKLLVSVLRHLQINHTFQPTVQSDIGKEGLILLVAFSQGLDIVSDLIIRGYYIKACAAMRQDYEFMTRLAEVRAGLVRPGQKSNMKNAPAGNQIFYGQLSKIVHPRTPALLLNFIEQWEDEGSGLAISHLPRSIPGLVDHLYRIHVWIVFEVTREALLLFASLYGSELHEYPRSEFEFNRAIWNLEAAGFTFDDK